MPPKHSPQQIQTANMNAQKPTAPSQQQPKPWKDQEPTTSQSKASPPQNQSQFKKVTRRSSKPIINWFQRKLAGTVKTTRRPDGAAPQSSPTISAGRPSNLPGSRDRVVSAPISSSNGKGEGIKMATITHMRRKTISLHEGGEDEGGIGNDEDEDSVISSVTRDSAWSPASALEADEDASLRPIPPSTPPSPSPSRSSSSYLSDPRTFRSMAASTKPTTLLSVDLAPNGVAHIAQVPAAPMSQGTRSSPHVRTSSSGTNGGAVGSGTSITFSALPPSLQSRASSSQNTTSLNSITSNSNPPHGVNGTVTSVQAPLHTSHHPRNNPRPSSPPLDNASVLTLASSAFAQPGSRMVGVSGWGSSAPSAMGGDSISHLESLAGDGDLDADGENTSQYLLGDEERDIDASVRALRPRSSRRCSWESEGSGWSARVGAGGAGTPSLARDRSLWTANSIRTDEPVSVENEDGGESAISLAKDSDREDKKPSQDVSSHVVAPNGVEITPTVEESTTLPSDGHSDEHKSTGDVNQLSALTSETQASHIPLGDTQNSDCNTAEHEKKNGDADDVPSDASSGNKDGPSTP